MHGKGAVYSASYSPAIGLSGVYGAVTLQAKTYASWWAYVPNIRVIIGGTVGSETITVEIKAVFIDGQTATLTPTFTATGTTYVTEADRFNLAIHQNMIEHFELRAKTTAASTSATVTVGFMGATL